MLVLTRAVRSFIFSNNTRSHHRHTLCNVCCLVASDTRLVELYFGEVCKHYVSSSIFSWNTVTWLVQVISYGKKHVGFGTQACFSRLICYTLSQIFHLSHIDLIVSS